MPEWRARRDGLAGAPLGHGAVGEPMKSQTGCPQVGAIDARSLCYPSDSDVRQIGVLAANTAVLDTTFIDGLGEGLMPAQVEP